MQIIKCKYLKNGVESGRPYTFFSNEVLAVGDTVQINESAKGVVTEVDVTESEIEAFRDAVKTIFGKVVEEVKEHFDVSESVSAQIKYCENEKLPHFAPVSGVCWKCKQNIFREITHERKKCSTGEVISTRTTGISVEKASSELITGCPHCNWSYCD